MTATASAALGFNADEYLTAMTPPSITLGGTTYTGRPIGFTEALAFQKRMESAGEDTPALIAEICTSLGLPADKILALPPAICMAAVLSFFDSLLALPTLTTRSE